MEIFIVGGAVRDSLMGLTPKDTDYVVVGATPQDMLALGFSQVGADFPVFLHPETQDEYALARTERKVGDGYHGFEVDASEWTTLADDLSRRDLTINAMALSEDDLLYDPFNGQQDLHDKVLRHVSPAFAEDPLRVVRLARFYARFNEFGIADETVKVSRKVVQAGELNHLPHERFWAELEKVMHEKELQRFFLATSLLQMHEHVDFFRELYGTMDEMKKVQVYLVSKAISFCDIEPVDALMYHTALTASVSSTTIKSATVVTQNLYASIQQVRRMKEKTAQAVFEILQGAKAWSQGPSMEHLLKAMAAAEISGESFVIGAEEMQLAWEAAKMVTSETYIDRFQGKELGKAIQQGRVEAIKAVLER